MKKGIVILIICFFAVGCTKYYKITDPTTDKIYYTKEVKKKKSGAVTIKDERTGRAVTIQSSEVEKITKDQFNLGVISQGSEDTQ